jgi:putative transposase
MERLNGEVRDREKVMRGLKRKDTTILTEYQIYHNYITEHQGLIKLVLKYQGLKLKMKTSG